MFSLELLGIRVKFQGVRPCVREHHLSGVVYVIIFCHASTSNEKHVLALKKYLYKKYHALDKISKL